MGKPVHRSNARIHPIFDDLERYLEFCVDHGYRFNEADLYNFKSYAWQQFSKFSAGKQAKDMWAQDARRFGLV